MNGHSIQQNDCIISGQNSSSLGNILVHNLRTIPHPCFDIPSLLVVIHIVQMFLELLTCGSAFIQVKPIDSCSPLVPLC